VNIIILLKNSLQEGFKIFFIIIALMNNVLIFSSNTSNLNVEERNYSQITDQAINFLTELSCTKFNLKLLTESFAEKFYSYEYCLNKPGIAVKNFTIISETISKSNSRNSSFLIAELTTST
jgi:hypothetical protein